MQVSGNEAVTGGSEISTVAGHFAAILEKLWSGKYTKLHVADFKDCVAIYHPEFKDFRQVGTIFRICLIIEYYYYFVLI